MSGAAHTLVFRPATPRGVVLAECQDLLSNAPTGALLALKPVLCKHFTGPRPPESFERDAVLDRVMSLIAHTETEYLIKLCVPLLETLSEIESEECEYKDGA